ncbi:DUF3515 domain-containing protein [Streptomyces tricolor]|nr:DUF3515 domain-containing protein [Streptomyces tricolor]
MPTPGAKTAPLCRDLDKVLPRKVDRADPRRPRAPVRLHGGLGKPAIILRCGIVRPPEMIDPDVAQGQGPRHDRRRGQRRGWLMEKRDDGTWRFTTANRRAYVQVTLPEKLSGADDSAQVLMDLAPAVEKAIPKGIASMRG